MKYLLSVLMVTLLFVLGTPLFSQILINEFMSSNGETIADEDGDYEDWIELYNAGSEAVNLLGYGLSDDLGNPLRWVFPEKTVQPGDFLLVWASGKNRTNPAEPLHTNFSIASAGEELLITHPQGGQVDYVPPVPVPRDVSYGRKPDGSNNWYYFDEPTPGASNTTEGYQLLLDPPEFSVPAGMYPDQFELEISSPDDGATIYYTTNGSEPDENAIEYTGSIVIAGREGDPNTISMIPTNDRPVGEPYYEGWQPPQGEVFKVNVIRARAIKDGAHPSPVITNTYLVDDLGSDRYALPVISLNTDSVNLFDPDIGIYVPGNHNNFTQRGEEWERPVHVELFENDGTRSLAQDAGVRIHGGTTRNRPRKSLRMYARSRYSDDWFTHRLFPDKPVSEFRRFLLRNSGNDWDQSIFRDAFMQSLVKDQNVIVQYFRPVVVFVNGEYWGFHNIRDRVDQYYIETHYGIAEDEMIMLENEAEYERGNIAGAQHYHDMLSFIENNSMASDQNYAHVQTMMDAGNFIDTWLSNIYFRNTDWPGNNLLFWRYIRDDYDPAAPEGKDGRWRWMLFDTDFGFGLNFYYVPGLEEGPAHNTLAFATDPNGPEWPNPPWSTFLLRRLLQNDTFTRQFINRYADLLNTSFKEERVVAVIDSIYHLFQTGMQEHIDRWRRPETIADWEADLDVMRDFANQRAGYQRQHIIDHFNLNGTVSVTLDVADYPMGRIQMNTIVIDERTKGVAGNPYPWEGKYFTDVPVEIIALPNTGYRFVGWEGVEGQYDTLSVFLTDDISITAVFEEDEDFAGDEMNPPAHKLSDGPYTFSFWSPEEPEGSFPPHMVFQQSAMDDPGLYDQMMDPYHIPDGEYHANDQDKIGFPYKLTGRTRLNGLGNDGISFINTGRGRDLGAAVLALDTRGVEDVRVDWTGGTLIPNARVYAIRLQYRTDLNAPFTDVTDGNGKPVEYMRSDQEGHEHVFGPIPLPGSINNRAYVQLRWKYYFTGERLTEEHGRRDMLRLDDIEVTASPVTVVDDDREMPVRYSLAQNYPNPFNPSTTVSFELPEPGHIRIHIYDTVGRLVDVLVDGYYLQGRHTVDWNAHRHASGVYIIRMNAGDFSKVIRSVLVK